MGKPNWRAWTRGCLASTCVAAISVAAADARTQAPVLTGRVEAKDGEQAAKWQVVAVGRTAPQSIRLGKVLRHETVTDAGGSFVLQVAPGIGYDVWAVEPGDHPLVTEVVSRVGPGQLLTLRARERAARAKIHVSAPAPYEVSELTVQAVPELTIFAPVTAKRIGNGVWQLPALPGSRAHVLVSDPFGPVCAGRSVLVDADQVEFRVPPPASLRARVRGRDGQPVAGAQIEFRTESIQLLGDPIAAMRNRTPLWRTVGTSNADGVVEMQVPTVGEDRLPGKELPPTIQRIHRRRVGARRFRIRCPGFRLAYHDTNLATNPDWDGTTVGEPIEVALLPAHTDWVLDGPPRDAGRQVAVSFVRREVVDGEAFRELDELILAIGGRGELNLGQVPLTRRHTQLLTTREPARRGHTPIATTTIRPLFNFNAAKWSPDGSASVQLQLRAPDGSPLSGVEVRIAPSPATKSSFRGRDPVIGSTDVAGRLHCFLDARRYSVLVDDGRGYISHDFEAKPGEQVLTLARQEFTTTKVTLAAGQRVSKVSMNGEGSTLARYRKFAYSYWHARNSLRLAEARPNTDGELILRYVPIYTLDQKAHVHLTGPDAEVVEVPLFAPDGSTDQGR